MRFQFYNVDTEYCDFLRKEDHRVPYTSADKTTRPFVGIVVSINGFNYYAPLTSPKPKHLTMKNTRDFLRINNGRWGAINFNNMIPVHTISLKPVNVGENSQDSYADKAYKSLLIEQLNWCNANSERIVTQAAHLYSAVINRVAPEPLLQRCCDFRLCERRMEEYCRLHGLAQPNRKHETTANDNE